MAIAGLNRDLLLTTKLRLLQMHFEAGVGHIGGNLSAMDTLLSLYHGVLADDDEFILSKGHAAGALYVALWSVGLIDEAELKSFHRDGTRLPGHPPANGLNGIRFATGSLGHGPGLATGLALAKRLKREAGHIFCLTSDAEWNEGSCWETLIFAKQHALENLTIIIDVNGLQGFGTTAEVADLRPLAGKFLAFGWQVVEVDGHDTEALMTVLRPGHSTGGPRMILANTRKGCGVSFMEHQMQWHYLPLSAEQYDQACNDLRQCADQAAKGRA